MLQDAKTVENSYRTLQDIDNIKSSDGFAIRIAKLRWRLNGDKAKDAPLGMLGIGDLDCVNISHEKG